ncbi:arc-type ribbon-helix-helix [Akkermansia glycaniphila]|uniref:Arc-type ribbon-helix-helix n=1 Tax=Akkermansia glycaniphila TaxID=1679444 RepID=A0A1H6LYQ7_9BACT|nr:hypothetical protein [Akkermansia glycaniphila]MBT9450680.1 hypothetical protein [Akkermansia glycaniphila]SEH90711.1 arc-type ribbon-helix-helix [Akkermansia glycaniphila]
MPNAPDPDKTMLSVRMPRTLYERLRKLARKNKMSITDYVLQIITLETKNITLTAEDYERIAQQTREAERRLRNR